MRTLITWLGALGFAVVVGEIVFRLLIGFIDATPPLRRDARSISGKAGAPLSPEVVNAPGVTVTHLNPCGFVVVGGRRYPAQSPGEFLDAGTAIVVVGVAPRALLVRAGAPEPDVTAAPT